MAKKFTKLTIGDLVVTIGGKSFRKLSTELPTLAAGLYDANDNLVASWDTLVNTYGLDITTDNFDTNSVLESIGYERDGNLIIGDVERIGAYAFNAYPMSRVILPNGLKSLGKNAFNAANMRSIVIPKSVETIDEYAFYNCDYLETAVLSCLAMGSLMFYYCDNLKSVTFPEGLASISNYAFCGCRALKDVVIPDSVETIGNRAFSLCSLLGNVKLPDNVKTIGSGAFYQCTRRTEIAIPHGCVSIGDEAFYGYEKVANITIPTTVTKIGASAFAPSTSATVVPTLTYQGTKAQWNAITKGSNWNAPMFGSGAISQVICTDGTITL